jgi:hypothetical protein
VDAWEMGGAGLGNYGVDDGRDEQVYIQAYGVQLSGVSFLKHFSVMSRDLIVLLPKSVCISLPSFFFFFFFFFSLPFLSF